MEKKIDLEGIFTPIVTPFKEDGRIDYSALESNIRKWNSTGLAGYVVFGSNGEYPYLTYQEKLELVKVTLEIAGKGKKVIVGSGCESTIETIKMTEKCGEIGAHAALVITPFYYKSGMTDTIIYHHFVEVAENSPIPILVYNVPKFTGINLGVEVVAKLSQHPNIAGIKDSTGNITQLAELLNQCSEDFEVMAGTANVIFPALTLGVKGFIVALGNICPQQCVEIVELFKRGELDKARELQLRMVPVNKAVTATYGIPGLKRAMDLMGYSGGYPRKPLQPLEVAKSENLMKILVEAGVL